MKVCSAISTLDVGCATSANPVNTVTKRRGQSLYVGFFTQIAMLTRDDVHFNTASR